MPAYAQQPPAVPMAGVQAESLAVEELTQEDKQQALVINPHPIEIEAEKASPPAKLNIRVQKDTLAVVELFSTQACTFCPKADAMMKDLAERADLIALSCHVDYFDVKQGSLSLPICSTRQTAYEQSINAGPKYTPQMVVNGRYDAIGYLLNEVEKAFEQAGNVPPSKIKVQKTKGNMFELTLPGLSLGEYKIWLFVFDKPKTVTVADGANRGKTMTYYNVVTNAGFLGNWNGGGKSLKFDAKLNNTSKGFAIIAQDTKTNQIIAATQYLK